MSLTALSVTHFVKHHGCRKETWNIASHIELHFYPVSGLRCGTLGKGLGRTLSLDLSSLTLLKSRHGYPFLMSIHASHAPKFLMHPSFSNAYSATTYFVLVAV